MEIYTFSQWVLFFYIYCFLGWVFECTYVSICEKRWVNRGFLKGPLLPIYGSGALCILIVTIPFRDNLTLMCLTGMVSATLLEYVTGAAMEKLFHVRYWDYTGRLLNLNGHICLASVLCWGVMTILVVDVLQVQLEKAVLAVNEQIVTIFVFAVTPFVTGDIVTSFRAAIHLRDILIQWERMQEELEKLGERRKELEAVLGERRQEFESAVGERRQEFEASVEKRRQELEASMEERKQELDASIEERRQEFEMSILSAGVKANEKRAAGKRERADRMAAGRREEKSRLAGKSETGNTSAQKLSDRIASMQELAEKLAALQERTNRLMAENDMMRRLHGKSIRGLLKRNPRAMSYSHRAAFADLKKFAAKKTNETKPEDDQESDE
ncbi:MAG: hypothetical protein LUG99_12785 [Lachnospiraceae bacterium]|nr:hypothetical protein [Lachnospiraceae bacterium]